MLTFIKNKKPIIYLYILNDSIQNFDVNKISFTKEGENNRVFANENDNENEIEEQNQKEKPEEKDEEPIKAE